MELVIADLNNIKIWNFATPETVDEVLKRAKEQHEESIATWKSHIKNYPDAKDTFEQYLASEERTDWQVMTYEDYSKAERERMLGGELKEIDKEKFEDALDVLPPLYWTTHNNVEMFCMSEMYSGSYTSQYAHDKLTDKYYTKMVDARDRSTWIYELIRKRGYEK